MYDFERSKQERIPARQPQNILRFVLQELMDERGLTRSDVMRATGIKKNTLNDWLSGDVKTQRVDGNIWAVARFFNVTIEYLCYGIGSDEPVYRDFEDYERFRDEDDEAV